MRLIVVVVVVTYSYLYRYYVYDIYCTRRIILYSNNNNNNIYLIRWFFLLLFFFQSSSYTRPPSTGKRVLLNHPRRIYFIYNNIIYITYCSTYTHIAYTAPSEYHPSCRRRRHLGQYYGNVDPFII